MYQCMHRTYIYNPNLYICFFIDNRGNIGYKKRTDEEDEYKTATTVDVIRILKIRTIHFGGNMS